MLLVEDVRTLAACKQLQTLKLYICREKPSGRW